MSDLQMNPKIEMLLFKCPFLNSCILPKSHGICKIPECKACSEYDLKQHKLKTSTKILY